MLQRLPSSVERDEQGNESERDDLLTLAKLLTNQVWQNLLNKADKQDQGKGLVHTFFYCFLLYCRNSRPA